MHESTLASQILDAALRVAAAHGATRVTSIRCEVTDADEVSPHGVALQFEAQARDTMAEQAALDLIVHPVRAVCTRCGTAFEPHRPIPWCPTCASFDVRIRRPPRCLVHRVDTEDGTEKRC